MGPTWGPSGADRTQVGAMLAPWTLLSGLSSSHPLPGTIKHQEEDNIWTLFQILFKFCGFIGNYWWTNSLILNDAIRWHKYWSTLVQAMVCCLIAPSHYLGLLINHYWGLVALLFHYLYPPLQRRWKGGTLVSACPPVSPSIYGQNRVHSISSTILAGSILFLHILSTNFRKFAVCWLFLFIPKFEFLAIFLLQLVWPFIWPLAIMHDDLDLWPRPWPWPLIVCISPNGDYFVVSLI